MKLDAINTAMAVAYGFGGDRKVFQEYLDRLDGMAKPEAPDVRQMHRQMDHLKAQGFPIEDAV